jgi:hypothetical protein
MRGASTLGPAIANSVGNFNQGLANLYFSGAFGGGSGAAAGAAYSGADVALPYLN